MTIEKRIKALEDAQTNIMIEGRENTRKIEEIDKVIKEVKESGK